MTDLAATTCRDYVTADPDRALAYHQDTLYHHAMQERLRALELADQAMTAHDVSPTDRAHVLRLLCAAPPDAAAALERLESFRDRVRELERAPARLVLDPDQAAELLGADTAARLFADLAARDTPQG